MIEVDDLLLALRETLAEDDLIEAKVISSARRALKATIAEDARPRRRAPIRRPLRFAFLTAAVVALASLALLIPGTGGGGRFSRGSSTPIGVAPASAQEVLLRAARAATSRPTVPLLPGQWLYYHYTMADETRGGRAYAH